MWPRRQPKRPGPEILITGLTGTGKTLVAKTLLRWGFDMGPLEELWTRSLEHPLISKAAKKICAHYDDKVNPGYVINPAWSPLRTTATDIEGVLAAPLRDERGRHHLPLPQFYPQVVKVPYVAALSTLLTAMVPPTLIIWCSREYGDWHDAVTDTDFFLEQRDEEIARWKEANPKRRGGEPVYPNLENVWHAQDEVLTWVLAPAREQPFRVIKFDVDRMDYTVQHTGPGTTATVLGMTHDELTERTKEEASGRGDHFRARSHRFLKGLRKGRPALRRDDFGRHSPGQAVAAAGSGSPGVFRFGGSHIPREGD